MITTRNQSRLLQFVFGFLAIAAGLLVNAQGPAPMAQPQAFDPRDISGYWELSPYDRSIPPAALTESGEANMENARDTDLISKRYCRALGVPAMMDPGRPLSITQGRYEILITAPVNTTHRHLLFRGQHTNPEIYDPSSAGESIAHWEGGTLIVDTNGFHEAWLDANSWRRVPYP